VIESLPRAYRDDLGRLPEKRPGRPLVDPLGLCTWGPVVHMAPQEERSEMLEHVRQALRRYRLEGAE
jgi:hypothetical protein